MSVPDWLTKFASRKLAALGAVLIAHYFINKGMEAGQAGQIAEAITQAVLAIVDGLVAWKYIEEQAKTDRKEKDERSVEDKGVDAVLEAGKKAARK